MMNDKKPLISIAPMMDKTDRHYRYFMRLITRHTLLYTEMITAQAIVHGNRERLLGFDSTEYPIAIQLGGSDPKLLAEAAKISESFGYDEINLNVGCPSDRVQSGQFGACLMAKPELVAECVSAMQAAVKIPITVKTRIGIDHQDSYEFLQQFVQSVIKAGCNSIAIHARKAWLNGLSPRQNREIPPLRYEVVHQIKNDFPDLTVVLNGGIREWETVEQQLQFVDGVMIGRAAYDDPYLFATVDQRFFQDNHPIPSREEVIEQLKPYIQEQMRLGTPRHSITRHILGLFRGVPGARIFRRELPGLTLEESSIMPV
ncbi:MAG: tRNA dihydrouridine(20/20a) synthase DusA [Proteobacteria bacterium]|nr:tRNA dihydrouridine(20/20a) synthase DusA [Pseudomonadota bacterium]